MEEVRKRVTDLLPVVVEKKVVGEADVLQLFEISVKSRKTMQVGGCRVINGVVERSRNGRVIRNGETIHEGMSIGNFILLCEPDCYLLQDLSIP